MGTISDEGNEMRQGSKQGTIKTTNPQSVSKAGEINNTVEDTSGWSTIGGNQVDRGRLALSTSAATTVTGADTAYPNLWANAPVSWRSGSNLVIPAQGVPEVKEYIDISVFDNQPYNNGSDITAFGLTRMSGIRQGNIYTLGFLVSYNSNIIVNEGFESVSVPFADIPFLAGKTVTDARGSFWDNRNSSSHGGGYLRLNGANLTFDIVGDFSVLTNRSGHGTLVIQTDEALSDSTPFITLYDNVAANALGLPEASASQSGTVTTGTQTFAGDKTFEGFSKSKVYTASVSSDTAQTLSTTSFAYNVITYATEDYDSNSNMSGNNTYTAPFTGVYNVSAGVFVSFGAVPAVNLDLSIGCFVEGLEVKILNFQRTNGADIDYFMLGSSEIFLTAGEELEIYFRKAGTNAASTTGDARQNYFTVTYAGSVT